VFHIIFGVLMNQINWARDDGDERAIVSFGPGTIPLTPGMIRATAIVFQDPASRLLQADLDQIAPSDATILLVGETGTGKELVSRYIHGKSLRQAKPFVAVNCGALSDTLAEADLFGHEKGAFTGALKTQAGWFEAANGGTLLLDEIGDLPLHLQVKLLRVLQEREVVRVGSRRPIPVDVRLIAATNVDLEAAVQAKRFREDLFFRLNVASVRLPPLRERPGDIEPLARHFLDVYKAKLGRADLSLGPDALRRLIQHPWPGNIRELENTIHNAALLARASVIGAGDIRLRPQMRQPDAEIQTLEGETQALLEKAIIRGEADIFDRTVRTIIRTAYELAGGNQVRAAETLGMSRNAFRTQLAHLGAIPARRRPPSDLAATATPPVG
jgi:transcriptional regulator with GAF, ATPase, and Fis domain